MFNEMKTVSYFKIVLCNKIANFKLAKTTKEWATMQAWLIERKFKLKARIIRDKK